MPTSAEINRRQRRVIRLMLIEDDPVFRLGLLTALEQFPDLRIAFEADTAALSLRVLDDWVGRTPTSNTALTEQITPDVIILSLDLGQIRTGRSTGLALCQQLKTRYPELPLLLISSQPEPLVLATALQTGANGYCQRGTDIRELVAALRQVARGRSSWGQAMQTITTALATSPIASTTTTTSITPVTPPNSYPLTTWQQRVRTSGLRQIETAIAQLNAQLQTSNLSVVDELFLTGRRRELLAARWLLNRLLQPAPPVVANPPIALSPPPSSSPPPSPAPVTVSALPSPPLQSLRAGLLDAIAARIQTVHHNLAETPLEIDILQEDKKRELLYIILRKVDELLADLQFSQISPDQLPAKRDTILVDLWSNATTEFFGKYYTVNIAGTAVAVVDTLLQDGAIVQAAILARIPFVPECLAHLLFQTPLLIDGMTYEVGTVEAMTRLELLLQNWLIQTANAVMQPLLNRFGNVEAIKHNFYDKRLLSTREVERFRNNLSWRYRLERLVGEPTAIFESRFSLLVLSEDGIIKTSIYAARNQELAQLAGIPLTVTLALETRDAIAPRLRSVISFLGSGVVYVLTDVIGRGIGLIGRGIVKGIGNALQDVKLSRNRE